MIQKGVKRFSNICQIAQQGAACVGRLDINTTGLLLFTNSGDFANRLMHPRYKMQREYAIRTLGEVTPQIAKRLTKGVELEDGYARLEHVVVPPDQPGGINHWLTGVLVEGRTRIVRRLFEAVGLTVSRLVRVRFGPIVLPDKLQRGKYEILPASKAVELMELLQTDKAL